MEKKDLFKEFRYMWEQRLEPVKPVAMTDKVDGWGESLRECMEEPELKRVTYEVIKELKLDRQEGVDNFLKLLKEEHREEYSEEEIKEGLSNLRFPLNQKALEVIRIILTLNEIDYLKLLIENVM